MEKYLEKLLLQIRCKKARPYIAEEIKGHIESQIEDNIADGMSYEEAEKNAVADMGDPVTVGISLDKIHKPQIAWKLLVIVGILSLLGKFCYSSLFFIKVDIVIWNRLCRRCINLRRKVLFILFLLVLS